MNDQPVIDHGAIDRLKEWGGTELPRKMIDLFLSHSPQRMDQIREGLSTGESRLIVTGAHSLKSSAGNVGAVNLQKLAQEAESLAEKEDMASLAEMVPVIEDAFGAACNQLETLLEGMEG